APGLPVQRFAAAGEEKTRLRLPNGFGMPYHAHDLWILNYMLHNITDRSTKVWITYDVDVVPATAPQAKHMRVAKPVWMDIQNVSIYPVYDALRGMGKNGFYTY